MSVALELNRIVRDFGGRRILGGADCLLLDEPANHLGVEGGYSDLSVRAVRERGTSF